MSETVQYRTAAGKPISGVLTRPSAAKAPGVILIHEWWGLNADMKELAETFAEAGFLALAVDLYDGKVTDKVEGAQALMKALEPAHAQATLAAWIPWLRNHENGNGKVGTSGYCLGGGWSLNASLANPVDATVVYYGNVEKKAVELKSLRGPVLVHFGQRDTIFTPESAKAFEGELRAAGKPGTVHIYDADHAFARTVGANYDKASADLAWSRTLEFLNANLR